MKSHPYLRIIPALLLLSLALAHFSVPQAEEPTVPPTWRFAGAIAAIGDADPTIKIIAMDRLADHIINDAVLTNDIMHIQYRYHDVTDSFENSDPAMRLTAVKLLGAHSNITEVAGQDLLDRINDENPLVGIAALHALSVYAEKGHEYYMQRALESNNPDIRLAAFLSLRRLRPAEDWDIRMLIALLDDKCIPIQEEALRTIAEKKRWGAEAIPRVLPFLELSRLDDRFGLAVKALTETRADEDPLIAQKIVEAKKRKESPADNLDGMLLDSLLGSLPEQIIPQLSLQYIESRLKFLEHNGPATLLDVLKILQYTYGNENEASEYRCLAYLAGGHTPENKRIIRRLGRSANRFDRNSRDDVKILLQALELTHATAKSMPDIRAEIAQQLTTIASKGFWGTTRSELLELTKIYKALSQESDTELYATLVKYLIKEKMAEVQ